jgi:hypothetical protein
VSSSVTFKRKV